LSNYFKISFLEYFNTKQTASYGLGRDCRRCRKKANQTTDTLITVITVCRSIVLPVTLSECFTGCCRVFRVFAFFTPKSTTF